MLARWTLAWWILCAPGCGPFVFGSDPPCAQTAKVDDIELTPASTCLAVTASDACDGGYQLRIVNSCSDEFDIDGQSNGPQYIQGGTTGYIGMSTDSPLCTTLTTGTLTCSLLGTLSGTPVTLSWTVHIE